MCSSGQRSRLPALTGCRALRTIRAVRRRRGLIRGLVAAALVLTATAALAQRPVCEGLGPAEPVRVACRPFALFPTVRFLADFTVDHHFKPAPPPVLRHLLDFALVIDSKAVSEFSELGAFLGRLPPLQFTQLDRTTGTVLADFEKAERSFHAAVEGSGESLALTVPPHVQGGYWRGPDVLQIAFWERGRFAVRLTSPGQEEFAAEIGCVSLTPDGLLVRFEPASLPPLLLTFRECIGLMPVAARTASRLLVAGRWATAGSCFAGSLLASSCVTQPAPLECRRVEFGSMGEENSFRLAVSPDTGLSLSADREQVDVAITVVPPISGPVALRHADDSGRELGRWQLAIPPGNGISTRCRLGMTPGASTCGATIRDRPQPATGTWSLEAGNNRVLEAGVAVHVCP